MSSVPPRFCAQFLLDVWPESKEDLEFYDVCEKMPKIPVAQIRIQRAESFSRVPSFETPCHRKLQINFLLSIYRRVH
jgi:hypothetical protein